MHHKGKHEQIKQMDRYRTIKSWLMVEVDDWRIMLCVDNYILLLHSSWPMYFGNLFDEPKRTWCTSIIHMICVARFGIHMAMFQANSAFAIFDSMAACLIRSIALFFTCVESGFSTLHKFICKWLSCVWIYHDKGFQTAYMYFTFSLEQDFGRGTFCCKSITVPNFKLHNSTTLDSFFLKDIWFAIMNLAWS